VSKERNIYATIKLQLHVFIYKNTKKNTKK